MLTCTCARCKCRKDFGLLCLLHPVVLQDFSADLVHVCLPTFHKFHFLQILAMNGASTIRDEAADATLTEKVCILFKDKTRHLKIAIVRDDIIQLDLCLFSLHSGNEQTCRHHIAQDEEAEQTVIGGVPVSGNDFQ